MSEMECKCETRDPCHEVGSFFCVECGRIWWDNFDGTSRPTGMYKPVSRPMEGVWVGGVHVKGPKYLVSAIRRCAR